MIDFSSARWRKSSRSGGDSGMCVEVARGWRKSSYSGGQSGQCVEVARTDAVIGVRDSKDPGAGHLTLDRAAFGELLAQAKAGALDL
ncbi:DUF397 domain-containing protein [Actinomadura meridiana]